MKNPESGLAKFADVQRACGLGRDATYRGIHRGELPGKKIGGKMVYRWEWINAWIVNPHSWNPTQAPTPIYRTPGPVALNKKTG